MRVQVRPLFDHGKRLPRWRHGGRGVVARLVVRDVLDQAASRTRRTASLIDDAGSPLETPSPLFDAALLDAGFDELTLSGVERITDERTGLTDREFAQVWHVTLIFE